MDLRQPNVETENRTVVARGWGEGAWGAVLLIVKFQLCKMKFRNSVAQQHEYTIPMNNVLKNYLRW